MLPVINLRASHGISSFSIKKFFSIVVEAIRSESLNSYWIFQPNGPNLRLSYITAWKKLRPKRRLRQASCFSLILAISLMGVVVERLS